MEGHTQVFYPGVRIMEVTRKNQNVRNEKFSWASRIGLSLTVVAALSVVRTAAKADDTTPVTEPAMVAPSTQPSDGFEKIELAPGKAQKLSLGHKIKRANILAPDIADVLPLGPTDLLVTGKKAGDTQLIIWDDADQTQIITIHVVADIDTLREQLKTMFPTAKIKADITGGTITLTGQVHDLTTASEAVQVAESYGKVNDFLEIAGGEQIMLKVKFAEVSKQAESELGFNFGGSDGISVYGSNLGANSIGATPGTAATATAAATPNLITIPAGIISTASMFGLGQFGNVAFAYFIDALQTDDVLRLLAEPNLVTTSGQEADFLAGGSFPYPVPQAGSSGSTITIQFQNYGVELKFVPIVLGDGRIRLKCNPAVSELDYSHSVSIDGIPVPGLTIRNVETTVEMAEGQTLAIGGLLQDNVTASNSQFPVLGNLPVLGALFRSVKYQNNETELVVLVTPVLVHPMDPADVPVAPGEYWRDPTQAQLFLKKDLGGEAISPAEARSHSFFTTSEADNKRNAPLFQGSYGFQPVASAGE
jgi:pilus assembly protein CpaC